MAGPVILGPLPITRHLPPEADTRHLKLCVSPYTQYSILDTLTSTPGAR
jgi:hypothetical protein